MTKKSTPTVTSHTCAGCGTCIPELSADYWRQRAHTAEELVEALQDNRELLISRITELNRETERLQNELSRFWA
jgi:Na+-translocating ferredoxin:NAD+ oxidoreductase RNF subunit RnfB